MRDTKSYTVMNRIFEHIHVVSLRQQGKSYQEIYKITKVPRATIGRWCVRISLEEEARIEIHKRKHAANQKARHASWVKAR